MEMVIENPTQRKENKNPLFSVVELNRFKEIVLKKRADAIEELSYLESSLREMRDADSGDVSSTMHHMADVATDAQGISMTYRYNRENPCIYRSARSCIGENKKRYLRHLSGNRAANRERKT